MTPTQQEIIASLLGHGDAATNQRRYHGPLRRVRLINNQRTQEGKEEVTEKQFLMAIKKWNHFNLPLMNQEEIGLPAKYNGLQVWDNVDNIIREGKKNKEKICSFAL